MQLFARMNGATVGEFRTDIPLASDTQWHEYYINIPEANKESTGRTTTFWDSPIEYIRLDPILDRGQNNQKRVAGQLWLQVQGRESL